MNIYKYQVIRNDYQFYPEGYRDIRTGSKGDYLYVKKILDKIGLPVVLLSVEKDAMTTWAYLKGSLFDIYGDEPENILKLNDTSDNRGEYCLVKEDLTELIEKLTYIRDQMDHIDFP